MKAHNIGKRIYLDANIYIYAFELVESFQESVTQLFQQIESDNLEVFASDLILTEILPKPIRDERKDIAEKYLQYLQHSPSIHLVRVSQEVIEASVRLRAKYNLRSMDALHLATAITHQCESFITNDHKLEKVSEIRVRLLDGNS